MMKINARGLRNVLRKFDQNGRRGDGTYWSIARGGYDLDWELYYASVPVVDCVAGRLKNLCLSEADYKKVTKIIISEYPDLRAAV